MTGPDASGTETVLHLPISKSFGRWALLGCVGFVAIAGLMIRFPRAHHPLDTAWGWFGVIAFGGLGIWWLKRLLVAGDLYTLDDRGINMTAEGYGFIRWEDIDSFRV